MPLPSSRLALFAACALAAAAPPLRAQTRDRWREEDERRDRQERERERRQERAERAREAARRAAESRARLARERAEREREARLRARRFEERRDDWGASYRPRVTLGGGIDVRDFGGEGDRFVVQGGVDFRSRSGFGVRPELLFAWSKSTSTGVLVPCATCGGQVPLIQLAPDASRGRSRMIGVAVSGTYTMARSSPVRPYLLSGLGVFSTRTPQAVVTPLATGATPTYQTSVQFRNDVDVGLTAGGGLEFDAGPVRLFTEFRYLLTDQQRPRGFSGMLPLTAGLRL